MAEHVIKEQSSRSTSVCKQDQENIKSALFNDGREESSMETSKDTEVPVFNLPEIPIRDMHLNLVTEKQVSEKTFLGAVHKGFSSLREDDALCDVTIFVEGMEFKCHKTILAIFSEYFRSMFTSGMKETDQKEIWLSGFRGTTIRKMITCIYEGFNGFTITDARELLEASVFFRVESLRHMCEMMLSLALDILNVIPLWRIARHFPECNSLRKACEEYVLHSFSYLNEEDIRGLDKEELLFLISSPNLHVSNEDKVYQAARIWFEYNGDIRKHYLAEIFQHIRQPFLSKELYFDFRNNFRFFTEHGIQPFVKEALKYERHPSTRMNEISVRTTLRQHYSFEKVLLVIGFKQTFTCTNPSMWAWRFGCKQWYSLISSPYKLGYDFATCRYGESEIYFSGGQGRKTFQKFDGLTDKILPCTQMKTARMSHCMVCVSDSIYVLGGNDFQFDREDSIPKEEALERVETWRPGDNTWGQCGNILTPVLCAAACVSGRIIFLYGGFTDQEKKEPSNMTQFFDTKTNTAGYLLTQLPFRYQNLNAVNIGNVTYILAKNYIFENKDELEYTKIKSVRNEGSCYSVLQPSALTNDTKHLYIIQEYCPRSIPFQMDRTWELQRFNISNRLLERVSEKIQFLKSCESTYTLVVSKSILQEKCILSPNAKGFLT